MAFTPEKKMMAASIALASSLSCPGVVLAQDAPARASGTIEEVVVTARKRNENLQDVPMAVSAFTGDQLQNLQVDDITEVARMTPNVTMNETSGLVGGAISVFMRGIGNDPGLDQGVGIYVDDIYLNRTSGSLLDVFDVERIELLKGPQGNLYGRNTIGGAVKYITREPGDELEANLEVKGGSDSYYRIKGAVSGPLVDNTLFGSVAFSYKQRDGYQDNSYNGGEPWDADTGAIRGTLLWTPIDNLKINLVADYNKDSAKPPVPNRVALDLATIGGIDFVTTGASLFFGPGTALYDTPHDVSFPRDEDDVATSFIRGYDQYEIKQTNVGLTVSWDINDRWALKSVTGARFLRQTQPFDFDGSSQDWINTIRDGLDSDDISQEFQLNFTGDAVTGVFGAYYLNGRQTQDTNTTFQTPRLRAVQYHTKDTYKDDRDLDSYSAYGNVDWDFAEDWQLSVGGRYTRDEKDESQRATVDQGFYALALLQPFVGLPSSAVLAIQPGQEANVEASPLFLAWAANPRFFEMSAPEDTNADDDWTEFTPSGRLSYNFSDDVMAYGGIATGFKSGGFNRSGGNASSYDPEKVTTYTLGVKSTLLDGTLRVNAEAFYNDYTDKQLSAIQLLPSGDLQEITSNVGEVTGQGAELEVTWLPPVEGLSFNFNLGYLDNDVDSFSSKDDDGNKIDLSNTTELGYSPEWTGQLRASYEFPLANYGDVIIGTDVSYQDEMYTSSPIDTTDPLQQAQQADDHYIWNAMVAFTTSDDRWRIAVEGKNLNDERVLVNTFDIGIVATGGYNPPRTWAASVGYRF
ncbi:MAG: TonB-dependent receptor [Halieaceae bacterium]